MKLVSSVSPGDYSCHASTEPVRSPHPQEEVLQGSQVDKFCQAVSKRRNCTILVVDSSESILNYQHTLAVDSCFAVLLAVSVAVSSHELDSFLHRLFSLLFSL